jgi:hypothetical protein
VGISPLTNHFEGGEHVSPRNHELPGARPNRREFARTLAALAATPLVTGAGAGFAPAEEPAKPKPADPQAEVAKALGEIAKTRYGKFLNENQLKSVQRRIAGNVHIGKYMARFKLKNGDEPAFVFQVD